MGDGDHDQDHAQPVASSTDATERDAKHAGVPPVVLPYNPCGALVQRPAQRVPTPHLQEIESLTG